MKELRVVSGGGSDNGAIGKHQGQRYHGCGHGAGGGAGAMRGGGGGASKRLLRNGAHVRQRKAHGLQGSIDVVNADASLEGDLLRRHVHTDNGIIRVHVQHDAIGPREGCRAEGMASAYHLDGKALAVGIGNGCNDVSLGANGNVLRWLACLAAIPVAPSEAGKARGRIS